MAKVRNHEIERFIDQPDSLYVAALLYGEDAGLVKERARRLAFAIADDPADPFQATQISVTQIKDEPALLFDEMMAICLTGGRRLVRLDRAGNGQTRAIELILNDPETTSSASFLLVEAATLGPRDSLRKLFESHKRGVAIPCYLDDRDSLETIIQQTLNQHGLKIETTALAYLSEKLGTDRQVTRSELEKLALFKGRNCGEIVLDDIVSIIGDGAPLAREDVAFAVADGDQRALDRALFKCRMAGEQPVAILQTVIRHFQRLHLLALKVPQNSDVKRLINSHRPPIFFKHQPIVERQLQQRGSQHLARAMGILTKAELDCKTTGLPAEAICGHTLIRIANAARPKRQN